MVIDDILFLWYDMLNSKAAGCTPLINRVRRHLASQCFEIGNLAALPCLSKCQKKDVENGVDALIFVLDVPYW